MLEFRLSSREMLLFLVPSKAAICSCVTPACLRKAIIWRFISNAVESASYSALTSGSFNAVCLNVSNVGRLCVIALYLFQSFLRRFHLTLGDFISLFDHRH